MKRQHIFLAILLIGVGLFFLFPQWDLPYRAQLLTWPSILLLLGLAFLFQSYAGNENHTLFSGWLLVGLGIQFHGVRLFGNWPSHWTIFTLIVGISFLFYYSKTRRDGLGAGIFFICLSLVGYFYSSLVQTFQAFFHVFERFWPIGLILLGIYLLFKKK